MNEMHWLNEPKKWSLASGSLRIDVDPHTDFWRTTHHGFIRDNGHFYYQEWSGDFTAKARMKATYRDLYDQGGLMIRIDERNWIKTGIEYVDGVQNVSAVVTRDFSDWSVVPRTDDPQEVGLVLTRKGDCVEIRYAFDSERFAMLRLAYFPPQVPAKIGMMSAAPKGNGFQIEFAGFSIQAG